VTQNVRHILKMRSA